jgi:hypothetical protein
MLPHLELTYLPLDQLQPAATKLRKLDPTHVRGIAAAIAELGFFDPILIGKLDGEARLEAAKLHGLDRIPWVQNRAFEREAAGGSAARRHPTVKPTAMLELLVRLAAENGSPALRSTAMRRTSAFLAARTRNGLWSSNVPGKRGFAADFKMFFPTSIRRFESTRRWHTGPSPDRLARLAKRHD